MKNKITAILTIVLICFTGILAAEENDAHKLQPGLHYRLSIGGVPESDRERFNGQYKVDRQGGITIPFAGHVIVQGMTIKEAQEAMEDALKNKQVFKNPEIRLKHQDQNPPQNHNEE